MKKSPKEIFKLFIKQVLPVSFLIALIIFILYPTLSIDYSDRLLSSNILQNQNSLKKQIEDKIKECHSNCDHLFKSEKANFKNYERTINENGSILLFINTIKTKIKLTPVFKDSEILWKCQSDKPKNMNVDCRDSL